MDGEELRQISAVWCLDVWDTPSGPAVISRWDPPPTSATPLVSPTTTDVHAVSQRRVNRTALQHPGPWGTHNGFHASTTSALEIRCTSSKTQLQHKIELDVGKSLGNVILSTQSTPVDGWMDIVFLFFRGFMYFRPPNKLFIHLGANHSAPWMSFAGFNSMHLWVFMFPFYVCVNHSLTGGSKLHHTDVRVWSFHIPVTDLNDNYIWCNSQHSM